MRLAIHHEGGDPASHTFLKGFLPWQAERMSQRLGIAFDERVQVIVSPRDAHSDRFPAEAAQLGPVVDPEEREYLTDDELRKRYPSEFYGLGVATTVKPKHNAPRAAAVGDAAIYLDVETIRHVADRLAVSREALLAHVGSHEIAHILRGHHQAAADAAMHGWLAEGDAQRDAWHALTDALAVPQWATFAREARAAQVRLARNQPPAYRHFDATPLDRVALVGEIPLPERSSWVVDPPRVLDEVMVEIDAEVPVSGSELPNPGDLVYLGDYFTIAGPWVVIAVHTNPLVGHPTDAKLVGTRTTHRPPAPEPTRWLQLRRLGDAKAGDNAEKRAVRELVPTPLSADIAQKLRSGLQEDIEERARVLRAETEALVTEHAAKRRGGTH